MELIRRRFDVQAALDGPGLSGIAVPFNVLSGIVEEGGKTFKERIHPGAADKTLQMDDCLALVHHDYKRPVARTSTKTLILSASDRGVAFRIPRLPDVRWARDLRTQVKNGLISECSFGYKVLRDKFSIVNGELIEDIFEIRLKEISFVINPAYKTGTSVISSDRARRARIARSRCLFLRLKQLQ